MKKLSRDKSVIIATMLFEHFDDCDPFETTDVKIDTVISIYEALRDGRADEVMDDLRYSIEQADEYDDVSDLVDILESLEELTK